MKKAVLPFLFFIAKHKAQNVHCDILCDETKWWLR